MLAVSSVSGLKGSACSPCDGRGTGWRERVGRIWIVRVRLIEIAHARSGDKGDTANVGLIARHDRHYPALLREVTAERVKEHFGRMCKGPVERFELPNISTLNFLLHGALGGGGTLSLRADAQGKTLGAALLRMEVGLSPDEL